MKTTTIYLMLLITFTGLSQSDNDRISVYGGFDFQNAVKGGKTLGNGFQRNGKALDYRGGATIQYDWWEANAALELFPTIGYTGLHLSFGKPFNIRVKENLFDIQIVPTVGGSLVFRDRDKLRLTDNRTIGEAFNPEFALKTRLDQIFGLPIYLEAQWNLMYRMDIKNIWGIDKPFFESLWEGRALYINVGYYLKLDSKRKSIFD